jgi:hypothetical protein
MKNDIADQFQMLNRHIAVAIADQDYPRATALDCARQEILKDICLMDKQSIHAGFFTLVEECARDNANLIQKVQEDMSMISRHTSRSLKAQRAYMS